MTIQQDIAGDMRALLPLMHVALPHYRDDTAVQHRVGETIDTAMTRTWRSRGLIGLHDAKVRLN